MWIELLSDTISTQFSEWSSVQFSSVQLLSRVRLFVTPWITERQASLSITNSWSSLKLTSIELVMPSSHLILCLPLLLLPPVPPNISLFSWVNSSHEVAKVLEFQLYHHSFQKVLQEGIRGQTHWNHNHRKLVSLITWTTAWSNTMKLSHAMWGHPRQAGHGGEVWQNVVHWRREWQTTSVFLPWESHERYEKAKW